MNIVDLYKQTSVDKHPDIIVIGDRLFFDNEEYILSPDGDLRLLRSDKEMKQKIITIEANLEAIATNLSVTPEQVAQAKDGLLTRAWNGLFGTGGV